MKNIFKRMFSKHGLFQIVCQVFVWFAANVKFNTWEFYLMLVCLIFYGASNYFEGWRDGS